MRVLQSLVLAPALFLCDGCFAWGTNHLDTDSPRSEVDNQTLQSFIVGSTTIEDVLLKLGEPQDHYEAPTVFLYRWIWKRGFVFFGIAPGGYGGGGGIATGVTTEYTLHILFDEQSKIARYTISKVVLREYP